MGIFSRTQKTNQWKTETTTPNIPGYAQGAIEGYYGKVGDLVNSDPYAFAPKENPLFMKAVNGANNLGVSDTWLNSAGANTNSLISKAANAPQVSATLAGSPSQYGVASAANPREYQVANVGPVAAPNFAQAGVAELPKVAQAASVKLGEQMMAGGGGAGEIERAKAESLLDNLSAYQNPYLNDVVKTTLAGLDHQNLVDRARYAAQGAKAGAFGDARFGIGETNLMDAQGRTRASAEAGLRADAFDAATNLSNLDAGRRQEVGLANAGWANERGNLNASLASQASIANANNAAEREIASARLAAELGMFNAGAKNDFGMAQFDALNDNSRFNAGEANDMFSQIYDNLNTNARTDAAATNQARSQFYDMAGQNSRFNADAVNRARSQFYDTDAQNSRFNADLATRTATGNADRQMQGLGLALDGNGQLINIGTQLGNSQRADIGLQADLGSRLMELQQQQALAPYAQLDALGNLIDPSLLGTISGSTSDMEGYQKSKSSGNLFDKVGGVAKAAGAIGSLFSDSALKVDVERLGEEPDGLGRYAYRYIWDEIDAPKHEGVMADEVAEIRPWALGPTTNGFATVNYGAL